MALSALVRLLLSAAAAAATAAAAAAAQPPAQQPIVQCAYHPTTNCAPPAWPVHWDMRHSTYVYCFMSCPLDYLANVSSTLGAWAGLVGVDHYWTRQGMPCIDGIPQEFAHQDAFSA
jgi:hypothetical protein